MRNELPDIAAYAHQDLHVWSALLTCMRPNLTHSHLWLPVKVSPCSCLALVYGLAHVPLQVPFYVLLSLGPAFCLKHRVFEPSLSVALRGLGQISGSVFIRHCLISAIRPLDRAIKFVLVFFASNLVVNAIPKGFYVALPAFWRFLDRSGCRSPADPQPPLRRGGGVLARRACAGHLFLTIPHPCLFLPPLTKQSGVPSCSV